MEETAKPVQTPEQKPSEMSNYQPAQFKDKKHMRVCLDFNQGGAMICLNPYVAKLDLPVGIGTGNAYNGSYPYVIQANYRAGYFTHYAGQGTLKSCVIRHQGEEVDLALERTLAHYEKVGEDVLLTTNPFDVVFKGLSVKMRSKYLFKKGTGEIVTTREILSDLKGETLEIEDYLVGCYGINEYSDDMTGITLEVDGPKKESLSYAYKMRSIENEGTARAIIPQIKTIVEMGTEEKHAHVSSSFFVLMTRSRRPKELTLC